MKVEMKEKIVSEEAKDFEAMDSETKEKMDTDAKQKIEAKSSETMDSETKEKMDSDAKEEIVLKAKDSETMDSETKEKMDTDAKGSESDEKNLGNEAEEKIEENKSDAKSKKTEKKEKDVAKKAKKKIETFKKKMSWEDCIKECKEFLAENGHCKIPTTGSYKGNKTFGNWVQETRRNFKLQMTGGKKPRRALTQEQIDELDELNFHWGVELDLNKVKETDTAWEANFQKLKEYKDANGDFDVPMESDSLKLAKWTRVQRTQKYYRDTKRKCLINKERIQKLGDIGFDWKGERKMD
ncbi:helicase [Seminavis robusta]|uniref:Helicase n=1 Tax=Seminavis robusta TaxID=568900 RepID=A0A9N8F311_9STRA|nr:helicase [Seminavis robusta]|eukprot:Sro2852_g338630.1 helicase (296) ;mRNA; f:8962-9849